MQDRPQKHPGYLLALALAALGTIPLPFIGAEPRWLLGVPLWLWWSLSFTALLSGVTAWGVLRYWKDDSEDGGRR